MAYLIDEHGVVEALLGERLRAFCKLLKIVPHAGCLGLIPLQAVARGKEVLVARRSDAGGSVCEQRKRMQGGSAGRAQHADAHRFRRYSSSTRACFTMS